MKTQYKVAILLLLTLVAPLLMVLVMLYSQPIESVKMTIMTCLVCSGVILFPLTNLVSWAIVNREIHELNTMFRKMKEGEDLLGFEAAAGKSGGGAPMDRLKENFSNLVFSMAQSQARVVRKKKEAETHRKRSIQLAFYDRLTGLANRHLFQDRLNTAILYAERKIIKLSVLVVDIDNFKLINDSYGHNFGDRIIRAAARRIREACGREDTIARLGGDGFVILMPCISNHQEAVALSNRILFSFGEPVVMGAHEFHIGVSIGITYYPADGKNMEDLIRNADMAMYHAKASGKGTYAMYSPRMNEMAVTRQTMENQLYQALSNNELLLYYQPKVDIHTHAVTGMEALLRWHRSDYDIISPGRFIPVAEDTGLIFPIGEWVLRTACEQTRAWHDAGYDHLTVSVNLSARQFQNEVLPLMVQTILMETGLPPEALNIEITETIAMGNVSLSLDILKDLKAMGVIISIDDFGTGYSSLNYLRQFPVDELKIDKSFVRDLPGGAHNISITRAVISLAKSLGLRVVAEGVHRKSQLAFLKNEGCDEVQGYYFSRPLSVSGFTALLNSGVTDGWGVPAIFPPDEPSVAESKAG